MADTERRPNERRARREELMSRVNPDSMIVHFGQAVDAALKDPEAEYMTPERMEVLMGLEGDEPDGLKFIQRFTQGLTDLGLVAELEGEEEANEAKKLVFGLPLRGVNNMFGHLESGEETPAERAFIGSIVHCATKQYHREGPALFCDMGIDFMVRLVASQPDWVDSDTRDAMMALPAAPSYMRPFTKMPLWEGETAGHMIPAVQARRGLT